MTHRSSVLALALLFPCALAYADQPPGGPDASPPPVPKLPSVTPSSSAPQPAPPPPASAPQPPSSAAPPAPAASTPPPTAEVSPAPTSAPPASPAPSDAMRVPPAALPWLLVAAEIGVQHLSIAALKGSNTSFLAIDGAPTGTLLGAAASVWLRPFTLGLRAHFAHFSVINYWNVGPEIGGRFPWGGVEPHAFVGVGYASVAGLGQVLTTGPQGFPTGAGNLGASGYDARLGLGLDVPIKPMFTVGGLIAAEIVHLSYSIDGASADATTTGVATSASIVLGAQF